MLESFGVPLPGETALIAFGILASQGHYSIAEVIAVAAAGAAGRERPARDRKGQRDPAPYSRFSSHFLPAWVKKKPIRTATATPTAA